jgi:archaemetzincin
MPPDSLKKAIAATATFFKPMGKPAAYDWLASHNEPGQTFEDYINANPTLPTAERQKLYVVPLGTFDSKQQKLVTIAAGYLAAFYGLPVLQLSPHIFKAASPNYRENPYTHARQTRTGYILKDILPKILPADAAALIAFTTDDLYPDETMYYVFGQASLEDRVGVWSLFRLSSHAGYDKFLRRTLKIAAHETGHMFSMHHCTKYECVMSGTNQLSETDSRPIDACPECMAKIAWLSKVDPAARYARLAEFCRKNGLNKEADEFVRKAAAVK